MSTRYWIVGGEYDGPDFQALVPGTETISGPFEDERRAHAEWKRLTCCPGTRPATIRYGIAAEPVE